MRVLLFKRFESSVYAFRQTIHRLLNLHKLFAEALENGIVPAGDEAQSILYEPSAVEEQELMDALEAVSGRYRIDDFNIDLLQEHLENDIKLLSEILGLVNPITPDRDAKLQTLKDRLSESPLRDGKRLIFTQYADTARYLFENLNPNAERDDIDVIYSGDRSKERAVGRFAPKANPEYRLQRGESELSMLIATDVLAEGLNLQDGNKIINYDLHWNPVRLIQRFGRIDRIGSEHDAIYGFNFLPETGIERNLGLREKLRFRIQDIHDTIGEDAAILDRSEQLNPDAMYAIYEQKGDQLSLFDDDEELMDLNEAEEMLRQLRRDDPEEFERIANLRDGIRAAMPKSSLGTYLFCQAGRFQQLFLLDEAGEIISRDITRILNTIKCAPDLPGGRLPPDYNATVMQVKREFAQEIRHRQTERRHRLSLTQAQRYVLRELQFIFKEESDEDLQEGIKKMEQAFRGSISDALNRELNLLRRNGVTGAALLRNLSQLYRQHNMSERNLRQHEAQSQNADLPKIVCSAALV